MKIYNTPSGIVVESKNEFYLLKNRHWDSFINRDDITQQVVKEIHGLKPLANGKKRIESEILPPIGTQEVWGAGVTYYRSRDARMEEAKDFGGGDFYNRTIIVPETKGGKLTD